MSQHFSELLHSAETMGNVTKLRSWTTVVSSGCSRQLRVRNDPPRRVPVSPYDVLPMTRVNITAKLWSTLTHQVLGIRVYRKAARAEQTLRTTICDPHASTPQLRLGKTSAPHRSRTRAPKRG